ncbi:MAG: uracil-xanthine permease family protein, partial [Candidatus Scatosoma sp.]
NEYVALICGLVTLFTVIACSVYGKKMMKLIPFIIGILAGYAVAAIFTAIGYIAEADALKVIDFTKFKNMQWYPDFAFIKAFKGDFFYGVGGSFGTYLATIAVAYAPVAFVVFAEHIADHKNLSSIINHDLLVEPGLDKTLLGDGIGSVMGAFFGGCPNTTYGESVGCVAITRNASVSTIFTTAIIAIVASFVAPFVTFLATIPNCVMGGVCITLYGFIAVSGLKMIQKADLGDNKNLFVVSVILIAGIGGMTLNFGKVTITSVACALILGILTNVLCSVGKKNEAQTGAAEADVSVAAESVEATNETENK